MKVESFFSNSFQRILLNGQTTEWLPVKAGVPQGFILGPRFCLIYINDMSGDLVSIAKRFADDTSLYSTNELNNDLQKISEWTYK